ncbi:MAG: hypothetical protein ACOYON_12290 [Fimbriimonas sp.]
MRAMHQIEISEQAFLMVQRIASLRQMKPSDVLELMVVEEAAAEGQAQSQLAELLSERRASANRGNTKPASAVLDRLTAKYADEAS